MSWLDNHFIDGNIYHIESEGQYIVADFWQPSSYAYAKITFIKCGNVKINGTNVNVSGTHDARIIIRIGYEIGMLPRMYLDFVVENNGQLLHYTDFYNNESFSFDGVYDATQSEVIGNGTITDYDYPFSKFIEGIEQVESDNIVSLRLCSYKGEKHLVTKDTSTYMKNSIYMYGQLTEECDVLNPSFLIQYDDVPALNVQRTSVSPYNPLLKYNYLFVDKFKRSYFINKITSVRKGLWRIDCHVDVLNTYDSDIRKQKGFVTRNEIDWNTYSVDDRRLLEIQPNINVITDTDSGNKVNAHFYTDKDDMIVNINSFTSTRSFNIVMSKIDDINANENEITLNNGNKLSRKYFSELSLPCVALDLTEYRVLYNAIKDNEPLKSYIGSVILYPFNVAEMENYVVSGGADNREFFKISDKQIKMDGTIETYQPPVIQQLDNYVCDFGIQTNLSHEIVIADFSVVAPHSDYLYFLNYEPYTQYELWIPYCGWIKLPAREVVGQRLLVYYNCDYTTGSATAYVKRNSDNLIIYAGSCQLGTKLSLSSTNEYENGVRKNANTNNMLLGLVGSAISTAVGIATENPVAIAGGVLSATKSIVSKVQSDAMTYDRASTTLGDSVSGTYNSQKVILKITTRKKIDVDENIYKHTNGYPCNDYKPLTSQYGIHVTGYTEIEILHYKPDTQTWITTTEISEIEELAKNGIIL